MSQIAEFHQKVLDKADIFFDLADKLILEQPNHVVLAMHEYHRNLYLTDPYIPYTLPKDASANPMPLNHIDSVLDTVTNYLQASSKLGSYFTDLSPKEVFSKLEGIANRDSSAEKEGDVQQCYNTLWKGFDKEHFLQESKFIIEKRFKNGSIDPRSIEGKTVLDIGCGSGRYSIGLAQFGPKKVTGIDLGATSISRAKELLAETDIKNVEFIVGSVLDLPFADNTFDFIFCNGVLHHSDDMEKGIQELHRVLKSDCGAWLYLYGDGGLYWYSRKKIPTIMKKIPIAYAMQTLDQIAMPGNRFFFCDNWYVPFERHTTRPDLEKMLKDFGFSKFEAVASDLDTDIDHLVLNNYPQAKEMFGDGELRYFVWK